MNRGHKYAAWNVRGAKRNRRRWRQRGFGAICLGSNFPIEKYGSSHPAASQPAVPPLPPSLVYHFKPGDGTPITHCQASLLCAPPCLATLCSLGLAATIHTQTTMEKPELFYTKFVIVTCEKKKKTDPSCVASMYVRRPTYIRMGV